MRVISERNNDNIDMAVSIAVSPPECQRTRLLQQFAELGDRIARIEDTVRIQGANAQAQIENQWKNLRLSRRLPKGLASKTQVTRPIAPGSSRVEIADDGFWNPGDDVYRTPGKFHVLFFMRYRSFQESGIDAGILRFTTGNPEQFQSPSWPIGEVAIEQPSSSRRMPKPRKCPKASYLWRRCVGLSLPLFLQMTTHFPQTQLAHQVSADSPGLGS